MRREYAIAFVLALAAIPAGVSLMVAPEYLHLSGIAIPLAFWGGIVLTIVLLAVAVIIAMSGEAKAPLAGHGRRIGAILGMFIVLSIAIVAAAWMLLPPSLPPFVLFSNAGKMIYRCPLPVIAGNLQERAAAIEGTFGIAVRYDQTPPGGYRIEATPKTAEGQRYMAGALKWTIEIRKEGSDSLVTSTIQMPEPLGRLFRFIEIPADKVLPDTRLFEQLLGVPQGTCRML
jgi:hypothetical protein